MSTLDPVDLFSLARISNKAQNQNACTSIIFFNTGSFYITIEAVCQDAMRYMGGTGPSHDSL